MATKRKLNDIRPKELYDIIQASESARDTSERLDVAKSTVRYVRYIFYYDKSAWEGMIQRMWSREASIKDTPYEVRTLTFKQFIQEQKKGQ